MGIKVLCFDALLEVWILKLVTRELLRLAELLSSQKQAFLPGAVPANDTCRIGSERRGNPSQGSGIGRSLEEGQSGRSFIQRQLTTNVTGSRHEN